MEYTGMNNKNCSAEATKEAQLSFKTKQVENVDFYFRDDERVKVN